MGDTTPSLPSAAGASACPVRSDHQVPFGDHQGGGPHGASSRKRRKHPRAQRGGSGDLGWREKPGFFVTHVLSNENGEKREEPGPAVGTSSRQSREQGGTAPTRHVRGAEQWSLRRARVLIWKKGLCRWDWTEDTELSRPVPRRRMPGPAAPGSHTCHFWEKRRQLRACSQSREGPGRSPC